MNRLFGSLASISVITLFQATSTFSALAGGGSESTSSSATNTNQTQTGNGSIIINPAAQSGNTIVTTAPTQNTSSSNSVSSVVPLTQLQNGNYNYTSTQFNASGYSNNIQCGLSIGASKNNSNTSLQDTYSIDVRYSSAQCPNYTQLAEQETKRVKLSVQGSAINTCIISRRDLAAQGKDPNLACSVINTTQFKAIMD